MVAVRQIILEETDYNKRQTSTIKTRVSQFMSGAM